MALTTTTHRQNATSKKTKAREAKRDTARNETVADRVSDIGNPLLQAKLRIGPPQDRLEREADRAADQVMSQATPSAQLISNQPPLIQRKCAACQNSDAACPECEPDEDIQRKEASGETVPAPASLGSDLAKLRGNGRPLNAAERSLYETRFGCDFGDVRLHTSDTARNAANAINARAFTFGNDIVLADSPSDRRLMAHELTHVIQQRRGPSLIQRQVAPPAATTDEADQLAGSPQSRQEDERDTVNLNYAFFFTGGGYGNSARRFFEVHYPDHIRVTATSFEQMFDRMYEDVQRHRRRSERVHVDEIVLVTHANSAGGLQIPLARDDVRRQRNFTPWDLRDLQVEFTDRTHRLYQRRSRFRQRRRAVVSAAIDDNTSVVVRGCRFGQSQDGLDALRSFFGGSAYVWAPRGFQGYEVPVIGRDHLQNAEEAFDQLVSQGLVPQDLDLSPEEKRQYLARELGIQGAVPMQFFVMDEQAYSQFRGMSSRQQLSDSAEHLKTREGADAPSLGEHWGLSAPSIYGIDPELDTLSQQEVERRIALLSSNYQPRYAPMLQRLVRTWERNPEWGLANAMADTTGDPIAGLNPPGLSVSTYTISQDASQYESREQVDTFMAIDLNYSRASQIEGAGTQFDEGVGNIDSDTPAAPDTARPRSPGASSAQPTESRSPGERQRLAAARSFDKRNPPPPQPPPSNCNFTVEQLAAAASDPEALLRILATLPETGWTMSDTLSAADLGISAVTAIPTILNLEAFLGISAFSWELIGLAAPLISVAGFFVSLSEARDSQEIGMRVFGVRAGLDQLVRSGGSEIEPREFHRGVRTANTRYYGLGPMSEYDLQIVYGYPLSADESERLMREGVESVIRGANSATGAAERSLRASLRRCSELTEAQIETKISELQPLLRRTVRGAIYQAGQAALARRRAQLAAQED